MEAKRRITKFDMSGEGAAVSLVSKSIGGAANQYSTLLTKSTDVVVELSMAEYISKFFDIWSYDAKILSDLLGYSDDFDLWDEDKIKEKTHILTKMKDSEEHSQEDLQKVAPIMKAVAARNNVKIVDYEAILKSANGEDPISEHKDENSLVNNPSPTTEEVHMETIEKSVYEAELLKAKELQAKLEEQAELQKGLEAELEDFRKSKLQAEKEVFIAKAKAYDVLGVEAEAVEGFAVALQKAALDSDMAPLVEALEKAQTIAKAAEEGIGKLHGHDLEGEAGAVTLADLIKSKKSQKETK